MSHWKEFSIEPRVRDILAVKARSKNHHFGRPFMTAYQIAILFAERYPEDSDKLGKKIGGRGSGVSDSLAKYIARELSRRVKNGHVPGIEGRFLHGTRLRKLEYNSSRGRIESSSGTASDLSMFRLTDS